MKIEKESENRRVMWEREIWRKKKVKEIEKVGWRMIRERWKGKEDRKKRRGGRRWRMGKRENMKGKRRI